MSLVKQPRSLLKPELPVGAAPPPGFRQLSAAELALPLSIGALRI